MYLATPSETNMLLFIYLEIDPPIPMNITCNINDMKPTTINSSLEESINITWLVDNEIPRSDHITTVGHQLLINCTP